MKMFDAYKKARRIADEKRDSAIVVIVDNERLPRSECYDAVTLDDWHEDGACGQFFDFVEEVTPANATRFTVETVHGEGASLFHVADAHAPEGDQPAIVKTYRNDRAAADRHAARLNTGHTEGADT